MWFGRYLERAESTARELQATLSLALDGELSARQCWYPLVVVAGEEASFRERFGHEALEDGEFVQDSLVWDERCQVALVRSIGAARENARSIRDVVSGEAWQAVNELYLWIGSEGARREWRTERDGFYRRVQKDTQLCLGLLRSTMLHDTVLDFMWLGMLLERVGQTARLLDVHHHAFGQVERPHQVLETTVWMALLRALSGAEPFMRAHAGRVTGEAVAGFLVGEARFPRSIAYCVRSAYDRLCKIRPPGDDDLPGGEALARLAALDAWVAELPPDIASSGSLHQKLTHLVDETAAICDTIGRELFGTGTVTPGLSLVES
jgi:uncharacterized alpha-E superfamily protein